MIPREEHIKQINRFHDLYQKVDKLIEIEISEERRLKLLMVYFEMTSKIWASLDNAVETIKDATDNFERTLASDSAEKQKGSFQEDFPKDFDKQLANAVDSGWVFNNGVWSKDGYKSRTSERLYHYIKMVQEKIGTGNNQG